MSAQSAQLSLGHAESAPIGGKLLTPFTAFLALLVFAAAGVLLVRLVCGIGATTNLSDGYPWGLWIAYDVVAGTILHIPVAALSILILMAYLIHEEAPQPASSAP